MKKTYIQPETIVAHLQTEGMIAASLKIHGDTEVDTSNGDQLTHKRQNYWGGGFKEEETNESYW